MKPISIFFTVVITAGIIGTSVYVYHLGRAQDTKESLEHKIAMLQSDIDSLKQASATAPTTTTTKSTANTQVAPTTTTSAAITDEDNIRSLVKDFEAALEARDANKTLAFFTDPASDQEKSDLDFLKGTDIDSPRLFSTRGSGALFAYAGYSVKTLTKDTVDQYTVTLTQKIQNYSDQKSIEQTYILVAIRVSGTWKVGKFYRNGIAEAYQKYNDQFGG